MINILCSAFIPISLPSALDQLHPPQLLTSDRDRGAGGQGLSTARHTEKGTEGFNSLLHCFSSVFPCCPSSLFMGFFPKKLGIQPASCKNLDGSNQQPTDVSESERAKLKIKN